jgi:guanylate kinase
MLVTFSAPPACGKSRTMNRLATQIPGALVLESVTTRPSRNDDARGEYTFVSEDEFDRLSRSGTFAWARTIHGCYYGTRRKDLQNALQSDRLVFASLMPEAVKAARAMARGSGDHGTKTVLSFFFLPPTHDEVLFQRLFEREQRNPRDRTIDAMRAAVRQRLKDAEGWELEARRDERAFRFIPDQPTLNDKVELVRPLLNHRSHAP